MVESTVLPLAARVSPISVCQCCVELCCAVLSCVALIICCAVMCPSTCVCRRDLEQSKIIETVSVQRTAAVIRPWVEHMEPFILVGPEGCGKSMLINHLVGQRKGTSVTALHCNAQTTSEHVIQRIRQACTLYSTNSGRLYRPRDGDRLVCCAIIAAVVRHVV